MKTKLFELANGYAEATGCVCKADAGAAQATLTVEGVDIQLGLEERTGMIVFQAGIGLFPESLTTAARAEFFLALLKDNNLFSGTRGFTLGVDEESELVTLQLAWDISNLEEKSFANLMNNFLTVMSGHLVKLDNWRPGQAANEASGTGEPAFIPPRDDFSGMLRV